MCRPTRRKWQNPWFIVDNGSKKRSIQSRETVVNHSELIVPLERADALCAFRQPTRAMLTLPNLHSFTIPQVRFTFSWRCLKRMVRTMISSINMDFPRFKCPLLFYPRLIVDYPEYCVKDKS